MSSEVFASLRYFFCRSKRDFALFVSQKFASLWAKSDKRIWKAFWAARVHNRVCGRIQCNFHSHRHAITAWEKREQFHAWQNLWWVAADVFMSYASRAYSFRQKLNEETFRILLFLILIVDLRQKFFSVSHWARFSWRFINHLESIKETFTECLWSSWCDIKYWWEGNPMKSRVS